jgi:hypothetical protein
LNCCAGSAICSLRRYLAIAGLAASLAPQASAGGEFRELIVRLDHGVHGSPLTMGLADGPGLLAVGQEGDGWRYSVVSLADGQVVASGSVPEEVFFYDTGDLLGRGSDQVCFLDERGVSTLDPGSGDAGRFGSFDSIYHGRSWLGPAPSDFARDVDGDGQDDVLVPTFDGWLLGLRRGDGLVRVSLDARPRVTVSGDRISYEPRPPRMGDMDGDGLQDVVFLLEKEFVSFLQGPAGRFSGIGRRDPVDAPLATDAQRARWQRDDGQVDQSELEIEEVETVRDFDGDGILDLLTDRSISEGVFDRRSEYHLYLGRREGTSVRYGREADGSIASDGVQFDPLIVDIDDDGRLDLATPSTRLGLARVVGALFSGRISVDLNVYRMRDDGTYPGRSDYETRFKVEFDLKTGLTRYPAVAIADFDGDGAAELMVQENTDELTIYPGVSGGALFSDKPRGMSLPLPRNGRMVEARDLDEDGRSDLLVRYGPADGEARARELRIFLSVPAPAP